MAAPSEMKFVDLALNGPLVTADGYGYSVVPVCDWCPGVYHAYKGMMSVMTILEAYQMVEEFGIADFRIYSWREYAFIEDAC
jgi:hypothetical protein